MNKILERFEAAAAASPEKTAYTGCGRSVSYGFLIREATFYGEMLRRQGTGPVLLYGTKEPEMVVAMLACLYAGRPYVPIHPASPAARVERIRALTGSGILIRTVPAEACPAEGISLASLKGFADDPPLPQRGDTAYIIFTSGSTGEPKGVPISVSNLETFTQWICSLEPLRSYRAVHVMNQASFSFDLSVADLYYSLCGGHTLIGLDREITADYEGVFGLLRQAEVAVATPTFIRLCLLDPSFRADRFPRLGCVYLCGEALDPATVRRLFAAFPSLCVLNAYGPTEATSAVSAIRITPEMAAGDGILPVGRVGSFATQVEIRDGEIVLRGDSVFGGYLSGGPGGFFTEDGVPCYRTGDLGFIRDGLLYCAGRKDDQIKWKGYRIELGEIEAALNREPCVQAAAVVAKRNADGTVKTVRAYVVPRGSFDAKALRQALLRDLPAYMLPRSIEAIDALPVNRNGKIDRKALIER